LPLSELIEDLQDRLRPIQSRMFPRIVLLELRDDRLLGQVVHDDRPQPVSIEAPLPALTCRRGMPLEKEPLGDLIGDLLVRDRLLDAYVMAALPIPAAEWRVLDWPFSSMPEDPTAALHQLNPPLGLSVPLGDAVVDLQPLPGEPSRVLLAAAPRLLVDTWIEVFNLAGARLERLAPAQSCQLVALEPLLREAPPGQLIALFDPLDDNCRLVLLRSGAPVFERLLPGQGAPFLSEVKRCLAFYRRQDPQARELRVLLTGPLVSQAELERELGLVAEELSPDPYGSLVLQGLEHQEANR
jgi:Tfp pilus assembly PilM family ATPase